MLVQHIVVIILLHLLLSGYQTHYNQIISLLKILYDSYFHQFLFFASLQLLFIISLFKFSILCCLSSASTTIFLIFYIALTKTIYTRIPLLFFTAAPCSKITSVLMFFVYFFLIFMFCAKTNVGYFNYLRFVYLFLQPSYRTLVILLTISFFISIIWISFTSRFNSNTSFNITQLHESKLC